MASSKARRRDRLSILDMSIEDDSLLPVHVCTTVNEEEEDQHQEEGEADVLKAPTPSPPPPPPPPRRRSKKSGHANLRKSLAWDKAFLTGEGVLEPDELPIAAKSPKKLSELPELPTLDINPKASILAEEVENGPTISSVRSFSERFDYRSAGLQSLQLETSTVKEPEVTGPSVPRILPPKKVIESAIQKGTRLRLPSAVTEQRAALLPSKQQKDSNFSKKVTLVSRKVKDTLGRVLPGRVDASDVGASTDMRGETANVDSSCSWDTCSVSDVRESMSEMSSKKEEHCFQRCHSTGSRLKTDEMRSGLRVPSAKLGFFESSKATPSQVSQSLLRSSTVSSGVQHPLKAVRLRPQGLPKARPRQMPSTAAAHPPQKPISSAPTTPRKSTNDLLSPAARFAASTSNLTPNAKAASSARGSLNKSSRRLGMDAVAAASTSSECEQEKESVPVVDASSKAAGSLVPRFPKLRLGKPQVLQAEAQAQAKSPLAVNTGLLNSNVFKEKGSFFAMARRAVGRLSSPVQEKENHAAATATATATASSGVVVDCEQEAKPAAPAAVQTGPVQHSPPNKEAPQPGPWSPVKKYGTAAQLGPFDCTKSNAQTVEWEAA